MKSEEEDERFNMTEEDLQHWVRARVEQDEQLVQRQAQLAQVENWVKRKEREAMNTQLLYNNACESVLECESVMKGLYGMLGLEYRDTDSEGEEEVGGKPIENVVQIANPALENGEDEHGDDGDWDDDYVVIDLGAAVPETALMEKQKEVDVSAPVESSECSVQMLAKKVKGTDAVNPVTKVELLSSSSSSSSFSSIRRRRPYDDTLLTIKTSGSPPPTTYPCKLSAQCLTPKEENSPVSIGTPIPMNEPPSLTISNPSTSDTVTHEMPNIETPTHLVASTLTSTLPASKYVYASKASKTVHKLDHKSASKSKRSDTTSTSDTAGKTTSEKKVKQVSPKTAPAEKHRTINPKQSNKPETKSSSSGSHSGTTDTTAPDKASKNTTYTKPPDAKEVSQTSQVTPVAPTLPARVQQDVQLKVSMSILGRRRTKTWHQGTILDINSTESGPRYKILFDGGKGKSVVSAHHLACVGPPMLKDLFVGCRVVASYKEESQSWLHAAVVGEMPDRKNRMRFLVFFDDGRSAYIALPDLHLVCKPLSNMTEDIEDEVWRAELEEYLQTYPNPIFVVMRVGQESNVERDGKMELCTISQLDGSLIQICYKKDEKKEWLFKGSNRLEQILKIKKRMEEQKKEQAVNKAGWIVTPKNNRLHTTTNTTTNSTTTVTSNTNNSSNTITSSTTGTTNITPSNTSPAPSVSQTVSPVTSSSMMQTVPGKLLSQPRVVLKRVTIPASLKTAKIATLTETSGTDWSNSGIKRSHPEEEDCRPQDALLPVVGSRLKYVPHRCCPACLNEARPMQKDQHLGQNPLLIPLLHRFRRMTARRRLDGKMSFHVFYRAPCGRSLCEMEEVQAFLFESRCDFLFLDMFCLDPFVLVKRALLPSSMVSRLYLFLPDISEGVELVPVRCANELNTITPSPLTYIRDRVTGPGVCINTSPDFMVGCDCTDGCRDRSKCACHQMTMEATALFSGGPKDVTAGYAYKRLPRYIPTGVYECNSLCRCDPRLCGNRLVQHGLQLRLEVFMTRHKGWGLRCLDDVSKGTFVCVFTGKIVKDEAVNTESSMSGNEYLANLDYIEGVEKLKEGYESEAYCSDKEQESDKKTLVTMTTGALKKHVFLIDSSSSSGEEITKIAMTPWRRERGESDADSEDDDDIDDVDFKLSSTDWTEAEWKSINKCDRSYTTRRNTKTPEEKEFHSDVQTLVKIPEAQTEVTVSMAKKMRKEGPGGPKTGFAKKSTRAFAIKSSHRRVKPQAEPEKSVPANKTPPNRMCTRDLFNGEKACYLIDAKQEGNLARYINHSCHPNLFVQNVFVDTHDLRFPWVAFFTSKRIRAGTELTWDYSYEVGSVEGKVLLCCCGSSECTGRLL